MHEQQETEIGEPEVNGKARKRKAKASPQIQVPGTEHNASKACREMAFDYVEAVYEEKGHGERKRSLGPDLLERMEAEGVNSISVEFEYNNELRTVVISLEQGKKKLKCKVTAPEVEGE
jgi:hypothetical protein